MSSITRRTALGSVAASVCAPWAALAQGAAPRKPKLVPGRHPGGVPIAILGAGVDYTQPDIAARLARDGEGEAIAWDVIDDDPSPFERRDHQARPTPVDAGTEMARVLLAADSRSCLIPVRVPADDPLGLMGALAFTAQTTARIAVLLVGGIKREPWQPFMNVARRAPHLLLIVPAGHTGTNLDERALAPGSLKLENMVTVTAAGPDGSIASGASHGGQTVDLALSLGPQAGSATASASFLENSAAIRAAAIVAQHLAAEPAEPGSRPSAAAVKSWLLSIAEPWPAGQVRRTRFGSISAASKEHSNR